MREGCIEWKRTLLCQWELRNEFCSKALLRFNVVSWVQSCLRLRLLAGCLNRLAKGCLPHPALPSLGRQLGRQSTSRLYIKHP